MSYPLVSVVINNYNYARFLADAVESALAQTYSPVEVVVVDDGSTDGSRELLGRWAGRVRTVLKENGGQASALNAGWAAARGELVLLLDADDMLLPDTAARAMAARGAGVAAVRYAVEMVDAEGRALGRTLPADALPAGDLAARILAGERCPAPPTSGTALDRALAAPLFPIPEADWRISADAYLVLLAPLTGRIAVLETPGARYRVHGANRWLPGAGLPVDWVRAQLRIDRQREAALRAAAARLAPGDEEGAAPAVARDWLERDPEHLQFRITSLRLDPAGHPDAGDTRARLGIVGARAALATRGYARRKRVLFALWFLLAALLPRRWAVAVIEMGFRARKRPGGSWLSGGRR